VSSTAENIENSLIRLRNGDQDALADLFAKYRNRLYHIVNIRLDQRLAGRIDADDILQEVYLDAADRIHHYINNHSGSFFVWLRMIATQTMANAFRRHLEAQKRDAKREMSIYAGNVVGPASTPIALQLLGKLTSPSHAAMREETARQLEEAIQGMKPVDREVIVLRHFEQLDNKEVAEVLGIQQKAASIRYIRAIARLKDVVAAIPGLMEDREGDGK
jgi:RNA polymerase sigma-70 factor (ECF subfamily)